MKGDTLLIITRELCGGAWKVRIWQERSKEKCEKMFVTRTEYYFIKKTKKRDHLFKLYQEFMKGFIYRDLEAGTGLCEIKRFTRN